MYGSEGTSIIKKIGYNDTMKFYYLYKLNIAAALVLGCFFISACENTDEQIKSLTSKRIGVEQAKEISINYSVGGKTKAKLTAPFMLRYQDTVPYTEFPKSLHVDFYDDKLEQESKLDAFYGRYMETESKVFLKDSVRLLNKNGDTMYTTELYWDRSRVGNEFYTDKPVKIRTKTHLINGVGFESSQDFKSMLIKNITNSIIRVPASEFPQ